MSGKPANDDLELRLLRRARAHFIVEGLLLLLLGASAIALPMYAALAMTEFLGALFLVSGAIGLVGTFGTRGLPGFWWSLLSALVAIAAGAALLGWPLRGLVSLAMVLSVFFIIDGFVSIFYALEHRRNQSAHWAWTLASGILTLLLASFILAGMPATAQVLGILVGIDMLFGGAALFLVGVSMRPRGLPAHEISPASAPEDEMV